jgi:hypothetical protein
MDDGDWLWLVVSIVVIPPAWLAWQPSLMCLFKCSCAPEVPVVWSLYLKLKFSSTTLVTVHKSTSYNLRSSTLASGHLSNNHYKMRSSIVVLALSALAAAQSSGPVVCDALFHMNLPFRPY